MNPYLIVGALLAIVGAFFYGQHQGSELERSAWNEREAKINAEAAVKIAAADKKVADMEHQIAANLSAVDTVYQGKLKEKDNALTVALNTVRVNGMFAHASSAAATGNATGSTAATSGVGDGQARCKLPDADAEFLLTEASRADKIVDQLSACQDVVMADRKR